MSPSSSTPKNMSVASPTPPSSPRKRAIHIDAAAILKKLTDLGFYFGSADVVDKVAWLAGGRTGDRLVTEASVADEEPEEVVLTLVGEVSRAGSWLSPEGSYRPDAGLDHVTAAKTRMDIGPPSDPRFAPFAADWEKGTSNILALQDKALKGGAKRYDRKDPLTITPPRITIRHPLLIARTEIPPEEEDVETVSGDSQSALNSDSQGMKDLDQFSFAGWPVGKVWRKELNAVQKTHDINPLPAYDIDHGLIAPKDYERSLAGAIVEVHFTLKHYLIGRDGSTVSAELRDVIVLRPPQQIARSPVKRKLADGPASESPKKRRI